MGAADLPSADQSIPDSKLTIPAAIRRWLRQTGTSPSQLALHLGMTRQSLNDILSGRRELADDRIGQLPTELCQEVAAIRIARYEGLAALVRHTALQNRRCGQAVSPDERAGAACVQPVTSDP